MAKIALFFGSFNPIHLGHLSLAKEALRLTDNQEVWFVVTPKSPFKMNLEMISAEHRLKMVDIALNGNQFLKSCDIEISENLSCFTIDTLKVLESKFPEHIFSILMGEDNLEEIDDWKDAEFIKSNYTIYVYPRGKKEIQTSTSIQNVKIFNAEYINISSTQIRESISDGKNVIYYLPLGVYDYIKLHNLL